MLNYPRTGNWFIPPRFFEYIDKGTFEQIEDEDMHRAFRRAYDYIDKQLLIETEEDEYHHFVEFYNLFSKELPSLNLDEERIEMLAKDLVYNEQKYVFYEDVQQVIIQLHKKYQLGIVSDAWPSLISIYEKAGLRHYFSTFIVSSLKGVMKPNKLMFTSALEELGIQPEEAIFIDDNPDNCDGANRIGINVIVLNRDKDKKVHTVHPQISGLHEIMSML